MGRGVGRTGAEKGPGTTNADSVYNNHWAEDEAPYHMAKGRGNQAAEEGRTRA